jgi:hypothetical protein
VTTTQEGEDMKIKLIIIIILLSISITFVVKSDARYVEVVKLIWRLDEKERDAVMALYDMVVEQDKQIIDMQSELTDLKSQIHTLQLEDVFIKSMINSKKN